MSVKSTIRNAEKIVVETAINSCLVSKPKNRFEVVLSVEVLEKECNNWEVRDMISKLLSAENCRVYFVVLKKSGEFLLREILVQKVLFSL